MLDGYALKEHTLNRLGYGISEWHAKRYDQLGFDRYVAEQMDGSLAPISRQEAGLAAKIDRAAFEFRQLETVLLDFWFNHFNVDATGGIAERTIQAHQDAIGSNMLGKFGDLLLATAQSPAMLDYLNNRVNYKEEILNGRQLGLNENYARELMELHTLGVDGGYTEADVVEVAKILTGWSVSADLYRFVAARHDQSQKTVMGATFPAGGGEDEGRKLLAMLAASPSTASFLAGKLCRRLVSENPPSSVVNACASAFDASDGDLAETVRTVLTHDDFKADTAFRSKVKPPHRYVASALLAMGANDPGQYAGIADRLRAGIGLLGETPYKVAPPTGYPESSQFWVSGASMLGRFGLANTIARHNDLANRLKTVSKTDGSTAGATVDAIADYMLPGGISVETKDAAVRLVTDEASTNDERVSMAALAVLSSPEFVRF